MKTRRRSSAATPASSGSRSRSRTTGSRSSSTRQNTWVDCLTTAELKTIWNTGSKVEELEGRPLELPGRGAKLYGPGTDSGTFDFFTEKINGKAKASRSDYLATEDDNVIVQGV